MKDTDIRIGSFYNIKVGKNTTVVRIMRLAKDGGQGWEGITLAGDKDITIRNASRIVGPYMPKVNSEYMEGQTPAKAKPATPRATPEQTIEAFNNIPKRLSLLDAAAKVLAEAKASLSCKQMMDAMTADGLWSPSQGGKTPANTLHASIGLEIKKKGTDSRFEKVGRGQFGIRCQ